MNAPSKALLNLLNFRGKGQTHFDFILFLNFGIQKGCVKNYLLNFHYNKKIPCTPSAFNEF
jgi:hypothetical protein